MSTELSRRLLHFSQRDSSEPSLQSSLPSQRSFSGTQRPFLQENSPGLQATTVERKKRERSPERGSSFCRTRREASYFTYHSSARLCCLRSHHVRRTPRIEACSGCFCTSSETPRTLQTHRAATSSKSGSVRWPELVGNLPQPSSSLPSPQSFQPSHCSVLLRHKLLPHWNLPGQADQSKTRFYYFLSLSTRSTRSKL